MNTNYLLGIFSLNPVTQTLHVTNGVAYVSHGTLQQAVYAGMMPLLPGRSWTKGARTRGGAAGRGARAEQGTHSCRRGGPEAPAGQRRRG